MAEIVLAAVAVGFAALAILEAADVVGTTGALQAMRFGMAAIEAIPGTGLLKSSAVLTGIVGALAAPARFATVEVLAALSPLTQATDVARSAAVAVAERPVVTAEIDADDARFLKGHAGHALAKLFGTLEETGKPGATLAGIDAFGACAEAAVVTGIATVVAAATAAEAAIVGHVARFLREAAIALPFGLLALLLAPAQADA